MHFQNSRISTVTFRDILVNSFMTYHAIDFDRYPIFTNIVLLFVVWKKLHFLAYDILFFALLNGSQKNLLRIGFWPDDKQ